MKRFLTVACAVVVAAVVEIAVHGKSVYHSGWFNVAVVAAIALAIAWRPNGRAATWAVLLGCVVAGVAAAGYGLLAPDDRTVQGEPGQRVAVEGLGTLLFPIPAAGDAMPHAGIVRPLGAQNAIVRDVPRTVVAVEAFDGRGNHLTITQPQGAVFLSPVLMMQHEQTISGLRLPFDSFNVPAQQRVVKAILFSPAEAAVMLRGATGNRGAVLFAVDDENDRPVPHGIVLGADGQKVHADGLTLRATLQSYPAVNVVFTPNLIAVCAAVVLVAGGLVALALPH